MGLSKPTPAVSFSSYLIPTERMTSKPAKLLLNKTTYEARLLIPMNEQIVIAKAGVDDSTAIAAMVGELLTEISDAIDVKAFNFDQDETTASLGDFLNNDKYFVFIARFQISQPIGFITLYENYALYAEGVFGTLAEL
jgi:hypothetical protein